MTVAQSANPLQEFQWAPQPKAEALVMGLAAPFLKKDAFVAELARRLEAEAGVRLTDLIDSFQLPDSEREDDLHAAGYVRRPLEHSPHRYVHEGGIFPPVVLREHGGRMMYLKVESVADFVATWKTPLAPSIAGSPLAATRKAAISWSEAGVVLVIERHGYQDFDVPAPDAPGP